LGGTLAEGLKHHLHLSGGAGRQDAVDGIETGEHGRDWTGAGRANAPEGLAVEGERVDLVRRGALLQQGEHVTANGRGDEHELVCFFVAGVLKQRDRRVARGAPERRRNEVLSFDEVAAPENAALPLGALRQVDQIAGDAYGARTAAEGSAGEGR